MQIVDAPFELSVHGEGEPARPVGVGIGAVALNRFAERVDGVLAPAIGQKRKAEAELREPHIGPQSQAFLEIGNPIAHAAGPRVACADFGERGRMFGNYGQLRAKGADRFVETIETA